MGSLGVFLRRTMRSENNVSRFARPSWPPDQAPSASRMPGNGLEEHFERGSPTRRAWMLGAAEEVAGGNN
jgi:hypothetical protein